MVNFPDLLHNADGGIDATGHLANNGLVNIHRPRAQSLTQAVFQVQNAKLFGCTATRDSIARLPF